MKIRRALGVLFAAIALVLGITTSASAQADGPSICVGSAPAACVWFQAEGEHFYVSDTDADGHSAAVEICIPSNCSSVATRAWNTQGAGTTLDYNASYAEGTTVYYRACYGEWNGGSPTVIACSPGWTHGTA